MVVPPAPAKAGLGGITMKRDRMKKTKFSISIQITLQYAERKRDKLPHYHPWQQSYTANKRGLRKCYLHWVHLCLSP